MLSIPRTYSGDRALIDYNLCNLCDMTYDNKNDKKYAKTITLQTCAPKLKFKNINNNNLWAVISWDPFRRWYTQIWVLFHTRALLVGSLSSGEYIGTQNTRIFKPETLKTVGKSFVSDGVQSLDDAFDQNKTNNKLSSVSTWHRDTRYFSQQNCSIRNWGYSGQNLKKP